MIEARFYGTYYFCNVIRNILYNPVGYLRNLDDFYGDNRVLYFVEPFRKYSVFHEFIEFVVDDVYFEEASQVDLDSRRKYIEGLIDIPVALSAMKLEKLPIEHAFEFHGIDFLSFESYLEDVGKNFLEASDDDVNLYMYELRMNGEYSSLIQQTVKEVFHVLFQNRSLLLVFNEMMSGALERQADFAYEDVGAGFTRRGTLRRVSIPKWVKRAVYFRDRGRCVICDKDLSGMVNLDNRENYDHMVPLASHGFNDVSNVQLLCKECNQKEKRAGKAVTSNKYQSWYLYD